MLVITDETHNSYSHRTNQCDCNFFLLVNFKYTKPEKNSCHNRRSPIRYTANGTLSYSGISQTAYYNRICVKRSHYPDFHFHNAYKTYHRPPSFCANFPFTLKESSMPPFAYIGSGGCKLIPRCLLKNPMICLPPLDSIFRHKWLPISHFHLNRDNRFSKPSHRKYQY